MVYLVVCTVALLASGLTFFSGFGLGTLLLPAFAWFFPTAQAVALTAVVHFLNGLFKLALVGRHADLAVLVRFGAPAIVAAFAGAWVLGWLSDIQPLVTYSVGDTSCRVTPVKLVVGALLVAFALLEFVPRLRKLSFGATYMPVGGLLSGFFGGLSGMQGALRSAFLAKAGLTKQAFLGTGVVIACLIDAARLGIYAMHDSPRSAPLDHALLAAAVLAAFAGAIAGNRLLKKVTMPGIQRLVAVMLLLVAAGLMSGLI